MNQVETEVLPGLKHCVCGARAHLWPWPSESGGKWWVCCEDRECDRETEIYHTRARAVQVWNSSIRQWVKEAAN